MGIPMLVVLVAISLRSPYDVLGHQVTFPSRVLFEAFDFVRAPGRFVIAAMVPLCALGALGLHVLGRRLGVAGRGALVAGAIVFSCAELALGALPLPITPPTWLGSAPAEDQPAWRWLEAHPGGAVMDYPQVGNTAVSRYYMYGWAVHHHPVVDAVNNAGDPNGEFLRTVRDPRPVRVPAILAGAGVRYALLNQWAYAALGMTMPRAMPDGFTRVATFPDGSQIWRVDARPSAAQLYFTPTGFDPEQVSWDGHHVINRRVLRGTGVVRVRVARAGTYLARFRADPLGAPATVTVSGASGSATVRVARPRAVSVPVTLPEGTSDVRVSGSPGPTPVQMSPWVLDGPR
jgi:hypothetical protein